LEKFLGVPWKQKNLLIAGLKKCQTGQLRKRLEFARKRLEFAGKRLEFARKRLEFARKRFEFAITPTGFCVFFPARTRSLAPMSSPRLLPRQFPELPSPIASANAIHFGHTPFGLSGAFDCSGH
jgi:hypothetical protein